MTKAEIDTADRDACIDRIETINEFLAGEGGTPQRVSADMARRERELLAERIEQIENDDGSHDSDENGPSGSSASGKEGQGADTEADQDADAVGGEGRGGTRPGDEAAVRPRSLWDNPAPVIPDDLTAEALRALRLTPEQIARVKESARLRTAAFHAHEATLDAAEGSK